MRKGIELEERDFFKERFSENELRQLIGSRAPSEFFSWNSPAFKKLGLRREELTDDQLIRMMLDEPRLIRRPLVQVENELIVGTDKSAVGRLFP